MDKLKLNIKKPIFISNNMLGAHIPFPPPLNYWFFTINIIVSLESDDHYENIHVFVSLFTAYHVLLPHVKSQIMWFRLLSLFA